MSHLLEIDLLDVRVVQSDWLYLDPVEQGPDHRLRVCVRLELELGLLARVLATADTGHAPQRSGCAAILQVDRVPAVACLDVGQHAAQHQSAVIDEADRLTQCLHLLHPVRREHDGCTPLALFENELLQQPAVDRVEPGERFVEHDEVRVVNHRRGELDLLLHPLRQLAGRRLGVGRQPDPFQPGAGPTGRLFLVESED